MVDVQPLVSLIWFLCFDSIVEKFGKQLNKISDVLQAFSITPLSTGSSGFLFVKERFDVEVVPGCRTGMHTKFADYTKYEAMLTPLSTDRPCGEILTS